MRIPSYAPRLVREDEQKAARIAYGPQYTAQRAPAGAKPFYTSDRMYSSRGIYNLLRSLYRRARRGPRNRAKKNCFYCGGAPSPIAVTPTAHSRLTNNQRQATHCPNCAAA